MTEVEAEPQPTFGDFSFGAGGGQPEPNAADDVEEEAETLKSYKALGAARRITVSAEVYNATSETETFKPVRHEKNPVDTAALFKVLEPHYLFKHLEDRELDNLVASMEPKKYNTGDSLCAGSAETAGGDNSLFHVIMEGDVEVQDMKGATLKTITKNDTCGATEMMYSQPRTEDYVARTAVRTFCITRSIYQRIMHSTFIRKRAMYCEFLANVKFLEGLSRPDMVQLADCLEPKKFKESETMIHCDSPPDYMYVIVEGTVKVVGRDDDGNKIDVCEFGRGDIVGEMEFLHDHNTVADVVAKSDEVRTARLERKHFEMCMGSLKDLLKSSRQADPVFSYYNKKRAGAETKGDQPKDPEKGFVIDVTSNRLPYTYAGQVKSLMKEGEDRVTLNALGRAAETAISTANRLKDGKLVVFKKIGTHLSARGVAGICIVMDKTPEFDELVKEAEARDAAAKETKAQESDAAEEKPSEAKGSEDKEPEAKAEEGTESKDA
jgi:CRP-like cAMP-binding protein|eukprot:CAMPEP_0174288402 /NCGR_PEP_ID=MMETSP0809-20121228/20408_1 /TAXON_ID=73025 ORGANISM="Eutreptiella gymnastica-like, Strain CCMP1594" /NCGR_SAMPLE_ID=MMETSP0809 /ASSEMBLY_ACC=CAM_ASM_000658 /LENGTH=493 /DNA_ID=CAMNT_0015385545 /DNA_START=22 /DNA_END=1503 /DNA_ORIENTATION=+